MEIHTIAPVYDENSKILILGSFPSVKSRETKFFYGHPQNRFWRVIAAVTNSDVPVTIPEKKALLLKNNVALWDVIASCDIEGSSDASIRNAVPNDLTQILNTAQIERIFTNGGTAHRLFEKYHKNLTAVRLPSTSPANAAYSFDTLVREWSKISLPLGEGGPRSGG